MKSLFLLLLPLITLSAFSQKQELTIETAVLGFDVENKERLHPESLSGIHWIPGSSNYAYRIKRSTAIVRVSNKKNDTISTEDLVSSSGFKLKYIPLQEWIDNDAFVFTHESTYYKYTITSKKTDKLLAYNYCHEFQFC